jgi:hypothetical protein
MIVGDSSSSHYLVGKLPNDGYALQYTQRIADPGSTTEEVQEDAVLWAHEGASYYKEGVLVPRGFGNNGTFASLDPSIATVDAEGNITYVSDGAAEIMAYTGPRTQKFTVNVELLDPAETYTFSRWADGSLAKHIFDEIDGRTEGLTVSPTTWKIFSSAAHTEASYVRNTDVWCADFAAGMSGMAVWNSVWGQTSAANLITPRHIVGAVHYGNPFPTGSTVRFVSADDDVYDRTVLATYFVPGTDIAIAALNEDLPSVIKPLLIPPDNLGDYLRKTEWGVHTFGRNQFGEAAVYTLEYLDDSITSATYGTLSGDNLSPFFRYPVAGDSGGPSVIPVNGELVLLSHWYYPHRGPYYYNRDWEAIISAVDAAAGIATYYLPEVVDLRSFHNYTDPIVNVPDVVARYRYTDLDGIGASVMSWPNRGTLAGAGTSDTVGSAPTLYETGVRFDGVGDRLHLPTFEGEGYSELSVFVLAKNNLDPPVIGTGDGGLIGDVGNGAEYGGHMPYLDGIIYDDFASNVRKVVGNPSTVLSDWYIYEVSSKNGYWKAWLNSTLLHATGDNTFALGEDPVIGDSRPSTWSGTVREVIFVSRASDTLDGDRTVIRNYLGSQIPVDPIVDIDFSLRLQSHLGDRTPFPYKMRKDSGETPAVADGDLVHTWSGIDGVGTQTDAGKRPSVDYINGTPVLAMTGGTVRMVTDLPATSINSSGFLVATFLAEETAPYGTLLGVSSGGAALCRDNTTNIYGLGHIGVTGPVNAQAVTANKWNTVAVTWNGTSVRQVTITPTSNIETTGTLSSPFSASLGNLELAVHGTDISGGAGYSISTHKGTGYFAGTAYLSFADLQKVAQHSHSLRPPPSYQLRLQTHNGDNVPLGLYQDAAMTIPAMEDGDPIYVWKDVLTSSGLVYTAPDSSQRPTLRFRYGVPVVNFPGGTRKILISNTTLADNSTDLTTYVVCRPDSDSGGSAFSNGGLGTGWSIGSGAAGSSFDVPGSYGVCIHDALEWMSTTVNLEDGGVIAMKNGSSQAYVYVNDLVPRYSRAGTFNTPTMGSSVGGYIDGTSSRFFKGDVYAVAASLDTIDAHLMDYLNDLRG